MPSRERLIESRDQAAMSLGQLHQIEVGDLLVPAQTAMRQRLERNVIRPEAVPGLLCHRDENSLRQLPPGDRIETYMKPNQATLGDRTGCRQCARLPKPRQDFLM